MPTTIIATAFITNPYQAALLSSGRGRYHQIGERLRLAS
jgi:N-acetylmuramoyl-L-alanine amidase